VTGAKVILANQDSTYLDKVRTADISATKLVDALRSESLPG
jgi:hypothetical protein